MGIGFAGGMWRGHDFVYNTAVVHVNNVYVHNTYVDRTVVDRNTIVNERHVAYSGGPGGINHQATAEERSAMHEQHMAATSFQQQHMQAARPTRALISTTMADIRRRWRLSGPWATPIMARRAMRDRNRQTRSTTTTAT